MSRIRKAYEAKLRALLEQVRARKLDQGVQWLIGNARHISLREHLSFADALTQVHERLAEKPAFRKRRAAALPRLFFCDSGLGGLARWLRAAGHDALWRPHIHDHDLVQEGQKISATILTTDSMLMERRLLRDGIIPAFWLPPTLSISGQLALVFREFNLNMSEPRCMVCGGELKRVDKEGLRERIPPRTYRWLDEYFVCNRCGKLFWRGTHWDRIRRELQAATAPSPSRSQERKA